MAFTRRDKRLAYQRKVSARLRDSNRDIIRKAKDVPCADCGQRFPTHCMDFDHRPGVDKVANIGASVAKWASDPDALIAEIAKCDVVCANCHRKRTFSKERKEANQKAKEATWGAKREEKSERDAQQGKSQPKSAKKTKRRGLPTWDDGPEGDDLPQYE